jgi:uncharacterized damage-inducible protein DinB
MPTNHPQRVTHPIFSEPVFNEGVVTADQTDFTIFHANNEAIYKQVEELLKTQVVGFPRSRLPDDGLLPLAQAWGSHGAAVVTTAVREILMLLVVHGAYHRARIAEILGLAGHQAPNTGYTTFVPSVELLCA